jgi:hypothetical protein
MALRTIGTNANNSLSGFVVGVDEFPSGPGGVGDANVALLNNGIRADQWSRGQFGSGPGANTGPGNTDVGTIRPRVNQPYSRMGYLIIPNRGRLVLRVGDFVAFDATTGWPIVVSADAAQFGPYTHVP